MRQGWMKAGLLLVVSVSGAALAQENTRTFVTELTISRTDGQRTTVLNRFTLVAPQGKTMAIEVAPGAITNCPAQSRSGCAVPAPDFGQLSGTLQVTPGSVATMGGFAPKGVGGMMLSAHLVANAGAGATDRVLNLQSPLTLYRPAVIGADVVNGQAIVYTVKVSEPNEVTLIK